MDNNLEPKKLRRVVIKEELVELTGDFKSAIVLNQLIYWSERVKDTNKFLKEEVERYKTFGTANIEEKIESLESAITHGWIYKKASELAEDCMIGLSNATMGRILKKLIENNWIDERNNPKLKWDRTKQYRVNLVKIQQDLNKLGYSLEGYSLLTENPHKPSKQDNFQNEKSIHTEDDNSNFQNEKCSFQNEKSSFNFEKAIPEITPKITTESYLVNNNNTTTINKESKERVGSGILEEEKNITFFELYTEYFGKLSLQTKIKLSNYLGKYGNEFLNEILDYCVMHHAKAPSYFFTVLESNIAKGITTVKEFKTALDVHKTNLIKQNFNEDKNKPNFNNFTQRDYDYEKLEKQLLGWEDKEE